MKFFHEDEFRCQHCGSLSGVDWDFASEIDALRERVGFPLILSSAYRCADHPIEKRKDKPGSHATGRAVDVAATGEQALKVIDGGFRYGFRASRCAAKRIWSIHSPGQSAWFSCAGNLELLNGINGFKNTAWRP